MKQPVIINPLSPLRFTHSKRKLQGDYVRHLDVVDFDIENYWSYGHRVGMQQPIRCYAEYSSVNNDIVLRSFPGQAKEVTDAITLERAPFCRVVGNLYEDDELYVELRRAEQAAGIASEKEVQQ